MHIHPEAQVYVYSEAIDMRCSIDSLTALLVDTFHRNPQKGDLFVFRNKLRNKIKVLYWDKNGFVLLYKRMEKGQFQYSSDVCENEIVINVTQLKALLMGFDFYLLGRYPTQYYEDFF